MGLLPEGAVVSPWAVAGGYIFRLALIPPVAGAKHLDETYVNSHINFLPDALPLQLRVRLVLQHLQGIVNGEAGGLLSGRIVLKGSQELPYKLLGRQQ